MFTNLKPPNSSSLLFNNKKLFLDNILFPTDQQADRVLPAAGSPREAG